MIDLSIYLYHHSLFSYVGVTASDIQYFASRLIRLFSRLFLHYIVFTTCGVMPFFTNAINRLELGQLDMTKIRSHMSIWQCFVEEDMDSSNNCSDAWLLAFLCEQTFHHCLPIYCCTCNGFPWLFDCCIELQVSRIGTTYHRYI